MFSLVEALNYRALHHVSQPLRPFEVLIGPNGSGKTTFLDVVSFLGRLVSDGLEAALEERTSNPADLMWQRTAARFELAIEADIPEDLLPPGQAELWDIVRYEIAIGWEDPAIQSTGASPIGILSERALLRRRPRRQFEQRTLFPIQHDAPETILTTRFPRNARSILNKVQGGNDNFYPEVTARGGRGGWLPTFRLGPRRSALANLPEDERLFPVSTWLKRLLEKGVEQLVLNSLLLRRASPPGQPRGFRADGSNLPWVIYGLEQSAPERLVAWLDHVRTAIPSIVSVRTVERDDDRHRYLMVKYDTGLEIPSWVVSDGTLRLLALTLPAYLPDFSGVYLIEEPENGIHPRAVESVYQSLSSVYDAQILMATHSPVILSIVELENVLCFGRAKDGSTDIVTGTEHPALRDWRRAQDLGTLFAAGVLS